MMYYYIIEEKIVSYHVLNEKCYDLQTCKSGRRW